MFILVFLIILAVLVLVHEFGHFIVAKKTGMKVDEFGLGFPPRLTAIRRGETLYSLNLIPLGGFVRITGEDNSDLSDPRSFVNKSFWARLGTLVAGVIMNLILAVVLFSIGFGIGLPSVFQPGDQLPAHSHLHSESISILAITPDSPAQKAGIKEGDNIVTIDGKTFNDIDNIITYVKSRAGNEVDFKLQRGSENLEIKALARPNESDQEGAVGIAIGNVGRLSYDWYYTPIAGAQAAWGVTVSTVQGFYALIRHGAGLSSLGGPVKIASLTKQVTQLGFPYIIQFAALLSINLAILNILPFPALDGGRVLFLLIEKIRGKRNNQAVESWANTIGFALLILLIVVITYHDIRY